MQCGGDATQSSAANDYLRFRVLRLYYFSEDHPRGRQLWPGRHPFWLKSASVLKSTATCQPMATCHRSS